MKSDYKVRAERFIKMIAPYFTDCERVRDYYFAVHLFNVQHHRSVIVKHGISRLVLITSDYVIKIDYNVDAGFGSCEDECEIYEEAKLAGFEYLFAQITHKEYYGKDYYIMPRIRDIGKYEEDASEYLNREESDWIDARLYDLHYNNYGWKDGHIVLIDYAAHY